MTFPSASGSRLAGSSLRAVSVLRVRTMKGRSDQGACSPKQADSSARARAVASASSSISTAPTGSCNLLHSCARDVHGCTAIPARLNKAVAASTLRPVGASTSTVKAELSGSLDKRLVSLKRQQGPLGAGVGRNTGEHAPEFGQRLPNSDPAMVDPEFAD